MSRYEQRVEHHNTSAFFRLMADANKKLFIKHFVSPKFNYPSDEELLNVGKYTSHLWKVGDSYEKLADQYYGIPTMWWLIAFYNQKPTEHSIAIGERLVIPLDLALARSAIEI